MYIACKELAYEETYFENTTLDTLCFIMMTHMWTS